MSESRVCPATNKDGSACRARPWPNREFCPWHDPDRAEANAAAQRNGGYNRNRAARIKKLIGKGVQSLADWEDMVGVGVFDMLDGKITPQQFGQLVNGVRCIRELKVAGDLQGQITELREQMLAIAERQRIGA